MLHCEDDIPSRHKITKLSGHIWRQKLQSNENSVLDVSNGVVVQNIYEWPFKKQLLKEHVQLIGRCFKKGARRFRTNTSTGMYQSLFERSTMFSRITSINQAISPSILAGNVADMSPKCRRHRQMLANFSRKGMSPHKT
jgi:hypothetical protein